MKRNYAIDFLRGIVTLSIIYIHTAWWSGQSYLPVKVSSLSLLLDVPAFMFIAGITFSFKPSIIKNVKNIFEQWKKYLFFLIFYILFLVIFFNDYSFTKDWVYWIGYYFPNINDLAVASGSFWFTRMYITVTILCSIIICCINKYETKDALKYIAIVCVIIFVAFILSQKDGETILFLDARTSFYSIMFLLGYISSKIKIKNILCFIGLFILNIIVTWFVFYAYNADISMLQDFKFPPTLPYLVISMFSILTFWYFKDRLKIKENNIIAKIGKHALFFYFTQGISSSLLFLLIDKVIISNIYLKLSLLYIINLTICSIISVIMIFTYNLLFKRKKKS